MTGVQTCALPISLPGDEGSRQDEMTSTHDENRYVVVTGERTVADDGARPGYDDVTVLVVR